MTLSCQHAALMSAVTRTNTHPTLTRTRSIPQGDQQMITFSSLCILQNTLKALYFFNLSFPLSLHFISPSKFVLPLSTSHYFFSNFFASLVCVLKVWYVLVGCEPCRHVSDNSINTQPANTSFLLCGFLHVCVRKERCVCSVLNQSLPALEVSAEICLKGLKRTDLQS